MVPKTGTRLKALLKGEKEKKDRGREKAMETMAGSVHGPWPPHLDAIMHDD